MKNKLFSDEQIKSLTVENNTNYTQKKVRFKPYDVGQNYLFPPTTDDYISKYHIARLIHIIIEKMDITFILSTYKGGGASSYDVRMMLKVWILGFIYKLYTSRSLEQATKENLAFLEADIPPSHFSPAIKFSSLMFWPTGMDAIFMPEGLC